MIKKEDFGFAMLVSLLIVSFLPFAFLKTYQVNFLFNDEFWYITSFLKFAILATVGESLGLRISKGYYNYQGFGLLPRAIVWGFIGVVIKMVFVIFAVGTPALLAKYLGLTEAVASMNKSVPDVFTAFDQGMGWTRILVALAISTFMNLIFAPVFMTLHKITDTHIIDNQGTLKGFFTPIKFYEIFPKLNWFVQWDFVFKRTIPFFWIPAHTITFLMPSEYRIIFAALLGIVLGVLLAIASMKSK